ncbi:MAG: SGNH/GDSL hydrolase family protein [Pyrinomonadaceae bacterium]
MKYIFGGLALGPFLPFLYAQGKFVRFKVGRLPDAEGDAAGQTGEGEEVIRLLAIGESTVAGVGAKDHTEALTGQFARHLSRETGKRVCWRALGVSGITVRRTLRELVPQMPEEKMDVVVVALGGNDVFGLSSPARWRSELGQLLKVLRRRNSEATIFVANVPMVRDFIALPNPLRYVLSRLAKMHHFNARDLIAGMENVIYFDDVKKVSDDFFSDGVHPSPLGYDLWSEEMVRFMLKKRGKSEQ